MLARNKLDMADNHVKLKVLLSKDDSLAKEETANDSSGSSSGTRSGPAGYRSYSLKHLLKVNRKFIDKMFDENRGHKKQREKTKRVRLVEKRLQSKNHRVRKIIKAAERAASVQLSQSDRKIAIEYLNEHLMQAKSYHEIAFIALFGVVMIRIAGSGNAIIHMPWGNPSCAIRNNINHYIPESFPMDQISQIDYEGYSNTVEMDLERILQLLETTGFYAEFITYLKSLGVDLTRYTKDNFIMNFAGVKLASPIA